ncbi:MAG: arsenate reductase ArsC [Chloroflexi bacterium]|nr:arsenate reductase ArsC [Chloroflexota bacterium]
MKKILFVCIHNSGRSQMAEAFFNHLAKGKAQALSAGTIPGSQILPAAIEAMREVGIAISHQKPKLLTLDMLESADRVITMGCDVEESCPASFVPTEDWGLEDPSGKPLEKVRQIRDKIKAQVEELLKQLNAQSPDDARSTR